MTPTLADLRALAPLARGGDGQQRRHQERPDGQQCLEHADVVTQVAHQRGSAEEGQIADGRDDAQPGGGARAAYQVALAKIDAKTAYRQFVQVKLDSMGGTTVVPAKGADAFGKALSAPPGATQQPAPKP